MLKLLALAVLIAACGDDVDGPGPEHDWICDASFCRQRACIDPDVVQPMHTCEVTIDGMTLQSVVLEWEGLTGACVEAPYEPSASGFGIYWVECVE